MYKFAAQNKLRFPTVRGEFPVEDLFDMPLQSSNGYNLDAVARKINAELKAMSEESFVDSGNANPRKKTLEMSLEIVKDVIKTIQEANAARLDRKAKTERKKKILDIIATKEDQALSSASLEELQQLVAAIDE